MMPPPQPHTLNCFKTGQKNLFYSISVVDFFILFFFWGGGGGGALSLALSYCTVGQCNEDFFLVIGPGSLVRWSVSMFSCVLYFVLTGAHVDINNHGSRLLIYWFVSPTRSV